ncbi:cysteine hydrolase family protein [Pseudoxanthomonas indica]|uniref:Nicotinamidase-related amidase n=1 Tax=Pseudoxanthomonas indica TaxID=428993 RepID=A0A1T5JVS1_9GAMM|nr:cysteine hydrolase family protein [Pseudoxanthomonas indica]GGD44711.1 isochorismatase [Pseudoxanthomonas indica]SKC55523.1 Nicotinamidase-related amidase [Pseudoxanthomonas indica]
MSQALLIIDVQQGLFATTPPPADADQVIACINDLSARARRDGVPVICVQHERAGDMEADSAGWQLDARLQLDASDRRLRKTTPDSFLRTGLDEVLAFLGVQELIICGYASEFCVDTTTRSAAAHGYAVILAADAHTTHDKAHASAAQIRQHHNATLPEITSFGPRIRAVPAADIAFAEQVVFA